MKTDAHSKGVGAQITAALTRQAARKAKHITVEVEGSVATLWGKVHSLAEREAAVGAAFSARCVARCGQTRSRCLTWKAPSFHHFLQSFKESQS